MFSKHAFGKGLHQESECGTILQCLGTSLLVLLVVQLLSCVRLLQPHGLAH